MKKHEIYNNFEVLSTNYLPELDSNGVWLKHRPTGMEVYHLHNTDTENLFSFAFKTPPQDSSGIAHILEHSVLCGSKNYPIKDPFIQLSSQSVKTFLNAMTFPDKTLYPASSIIEADYFNLFAVYGDAVFFPLLDEKIFKQEAWHLEFDEKENLAFQGVVYNEMKGNYSNLESIASDWTYRSLLNGTPYEQDSGGDPHAIPLLTYKQFIQFYRQFYHPANCRLFLYGNIPTEKQLDFIAERFLSAFTGENPICPEIPFAKTFTVPKKLSIAAPGTSDETGATVLVSWVVADGTDGVASMEASFLTEILLGHDASPLSKALIECELGEDISPVTGLETELKQCCFSVGLRGMDATKASELENCIFSVLQDIQKNGVSQADLEAALLSMDFSNREIRRSSGPFALVLMRRSLKGWLHGKNPEDTLINSRLFDEVKNRLKNDSHYIQNLVKKLLLENNHRTILTVYPDENYEKNFEEKTQALIQNIATDKKTIAQEQRDLQEFQQKPDEQSVRSRIPHLKPADLSGRIDTIDTKFSKLADVPLLINEETTNGITYLLLAFPVDTLKPDDFILLPFFSTAITSIGFDGMNWSEAAAYTARIFGGFGANLFSSSTANSENNFSESAEKQALQGRSWIFLRIKMLNEKIEEAIKILFSCIQKPDFSDTKRLKDLALEFRNDFKSSIVPDGHQYAASRATCTLNRHRAIDEIWNGLTQLYFLQDLTQMNQKELQRKLTNLHKKILNSGLLLHLTSDKNGIQASRKHLTPYAKNFCFPQNPYPASDKDFFVHTELFKTNDDSHTETECFTGPMQVGFASLAFPASSFATRESVHEALLSHYLSTGLLWEKIRTIGGAYGAFSVTDATEQMFILETYRDPNPEKSLGVFIDCLTIMTETLLDTNELERAIAGCYSKEVQPRAPANKGFTGLIRFLYGITDKKRTEKLEYLLSAQSQEIILAAKRLLSHQAEQKAVIITGKPLAYYRKQKKLPI